jgi:Flp pilus assembly protein TadG
VVDFVLVSVLLALLLFAVLQVAVFFYARTIVAAAAADAARYGALAGSSPSLGAERAQLLIAQSLGRADATQIHCTAAARTDAPSGLPEVTVTCTGHLHAVFAPLRLPVTIHVVASALTEPPP